ncbi:unnamed protein product [Lupinus luteus]|uniref:Uncharacterized protein n=1 Tax=Lupinus luteus TaxID=3873 RepID=A0AAV1XTU9_LUPLU
MGGCATKPEVLKDDDSDVNVNAPEAEPEPEPSHVDVVDETNVAQEPQPEINTVVDDDQTNKRRSLSLLFIKENDVTEVFTENDKTAVEEIVKQETLEAQKPLEDIKSIETKLEAQKPLEDIKSIETKLEAQKPLEDIKSIETIVNHEFSKAEAEENKLLNIEPLEQDSPLLIKLEEKSSVQNESNKLDEELVLKLESKIEKLLEENQIIETPKQEFGDAKETPSHGSKSDKPETLIEETAVTKVATQPKKKVIETLSTDAGSVPKIITEKATHSSREEKNHNEVEHASKASGASNIKT